MGADHVIDYTREDFTKNGQSYDLILGVNGYHSVLSYRSAPSPKGVYVFVGSSRVLTLLLQTTLLGPLISKKNGKKLSFMGIAKLNEHDLAILKELLEAGKVKPVIDRRFPLGETTDAFRYLGEGHARGKVVVTMKPDA
jgi:NADPH:quinone reductase-like Zn-dependent oxidoreductase